MGEGVVPERSHQEVPDPEKSKGAVEQSAFQGEPGMAEELHAEVERRGNQKRGANLMKLRMIYDQLS